MDLFEQWSHIHNVGILEIWHIYRVPILLVAVLLFFIVRHITVVRSKRERISYSPSAGSPVLPPATTKELACLEEKDRTSPIAIAAKQDLSLSRVDIVEHAGASPSTKRLRLAPKRVTGSRINRNPKPQAIETQSQALRIQPLLFFSSLTGTTEKISKKLVEDFTSSSIVQSGLILEPQLHDLSYIDYDDYFITPPKQTSSSQTTRYFYLLVLPSYNIDTILHTFLAHLEETHNDFRIDTGSMSDLLGYSVFGFGDREGWPTEEEGFCSQAKEVDKWMAKLTGRKRAFPLGTGDVKSDGMQRLGQWILGVQEVLQGIITQGELGEGVLGSGDALESDEEDEEVEPPDDLSSESFTQPISRTPRIKRRRITTTQSVADLEDLTSKISSSPLPIDFTTTPTQPTTPLKEMVPVSSPTHAALTKQGYSIIGSHSGVKICRWTKSALRGRGSCYKYSFYGIASHLCMETTPSLSCSNKCVFCWRHGTNPVATTWRWQVDPPDLIFEGAKKEHLRKIKMMRGVPGVRAERFQEAMRIRHCALSLVGEPIFYPHINELLSLLHAEHISSFLVCNAQHPAQLAALKHVTQLYVSIDASNRESLRKIDRPLHRDFWERFLACLDILRNRRGSMRTVFRLTLVKGFNIDQEVEGYADLVARGLPCFVEIKGVTYCGTSTSASAGLTMQNVPFYSEIAAFVTALDAALARRGLDYGIAAEHAHSCCVLIASRLFFIKGKWHTRISYERYFECLEKGVPFGPEDYVGAETPKWALWGNGGFDPRDERVYRKGKGKEKGKLENGGENEMG